ncbi:LysR family transcriptional regulator [Planotetraspora sp. GP83]|uniref:LysR family transcriptional regulator n=1 Tax=Planotetraspora sp. GP83 TaxID=3156264 RepID=UPI0035194359
MDLRHLEYFVAVAEELNFTKAARRLHVVQSAVSAAIRSLERELGVTLFERSAQRVALSDAGAALLPEARGLLEAARAVRQSVQGVDRQLGGTVSIGMLPAMPIVDLPALLGRFHREHPEVTVRLRMTGTGSSGLAEAVASGEVDIAILAMPARPPSALAAHRLADARLVLVMHPDHPLAGEQSVALARLAQENFVDFPPGYSTRAMVDRVFAAAGLERRIPLEVPDLTTCCAFVREGLGIAVVPEFAVVNEPGLSIVYLADTVLIWPLVLATSAARRPSAAVRALLDLVDSYLLVPVSPALSSDGPS